MKTVVTLSAVFVALTLLAWTFRAMAQNSDPGKPGPPMMMMDHQTWMDRWMDRMKDMGVSDAMMSRCRMMRTLEVSAYDPASILALKDELQLNTNQVRKLQALLNASRDGVRAILTEGQKEQLQAIENTPASVIKMHKHMMGRM